MPCPRSSSPRPSRRNSSRAIRGRHRCGRGRDAVDPHRRRGGMAAPRRGARGQQHGFDSVFAFYRSVDPLLHDLAADARREPGRGVRAPARRPWIVPGERRWLVAGAVEDGPEEAAAASPAAAVHPAAAVPRGAGSMFSSPDERRRLGNAIRDVEDDTSGEIVVVVCRAGGRYRAMPILWAVPGGAATPWPLIWITALGASRIFMIQLAVGARCSASPIAAEAALRPGAGLHQAGPGPRGGHRASSSPAASPGRGSAPAC